jgi:butyryl-CoA dehydrogenase
MKQRGDESMELTDAVAARDAMVLAAVEHLAATLPLDAEAAFPAQALRAFASAGVFGMNIPLEYGGLDLSFRAQAGIFSRLAEADLTAAFVLSQHQACASLLVASPNPAIRARWLRRMAVGEALGANGFNFLNFPPDRAPMRAERHGDSFRLAGTMPWVTAAGECHVLAAGAVLPDSDQILAALPMSDLLAGHDSRVRVPPAMELAALTGSATTEVQCDALDVPAEDLALGPGRDLLKSALRGATVYVPTAAALGHARASLRLIEDVARRKGGTAVETAAWLAERIIALDAGLTAALLAHDFTQAPILRGRANALAARAAHLALISGGGTGFRQGERAQQLYREAGFFSVWSVSGAIIPQTLTHLLQGM